jgi:polysaccharide biosynthesis/export protein
MKPLVLLIIVCALLGCASPPPPRAAMPLSVQPVASLAYHIQPGDTFDIKFFYNPELNETAITVRPDGKIALQLIPEIQAAGLSPSDLRRVLIETYSKEINKPELSIIMRSFASWRVFVDGEVARPGMLALTGPTTIMQSIAAAGGMRETARASEVILIRRGPDAKPYPLVVNLEAVKQGRDLAQDIPLYASDIVFVPKSTIANVNTFVDLYIRRNIPVGVGMGLGYDLNN